MAHHFSKSIFCTGEEKKSFQSLRLCQLQNRSSLCSYCVPVSCFQPLSPILDDSPFSVHCANGMRRVWRPEYLQECRGMPECWGVGEEIKGPRRCIVCQQPSAAYLPMLAWHIWFLELL